MSVRHKQRGSKRLSRVYSSWRSNSCTSCSLLTIHQINGRSPRGVKEAVVSSSSFASDISVVNCVKPERQGFQRANSAEDANAASFRVQMHIVFMGSPRSGNNARYLVWVQLRPGLIIRVPDRSVCACQTSSKQFILLFFSIPACSLKLTTIFVVKAPFEYPKRKLHHRSHKYRQGL